MSREKTEKSKKKEASKADQIFELIHQLMHLFRAEQYRTLRNGDYNLTHMEGKLMSFFALHPGSTLRDLVDFMGKDKGQLARLIRSLRTQGLLEGETNPNDKRSIHLFLTKEGLAVHEELGKNLSKLTKIAVQGMKLDEQAQLIATLDHIKSNVQAASSR